MDKELKRIYKAQANSIRMRVLELYLELMEGGGISSTQLYQYGRYRQLLVEIEKILGVTAGRQLSIMESELNKAYQAAFAKPVIAGETAAIWGLQNRLAMEQVVNGNFKGSHFSARIWKSRQATFDLLKKELENVIASGQSKDMAVKAIRHATDASFSNADRLVRTETMRVINAGRRQRFIEAGYTHGYYVVKDDDRLCKYCNEIAAKTKADPMPLQEMEDCHHPNCRCTIVPKVI